VAWEEQDHEQGGVEYRANSQIVIVRAVFASHWTWGNGAVMPGSEGPLFTRQSCILRGMLPSRDADRPIIHSGLILVIALAASGGGNMNYWLRRCLFEWSLRFGVDW